MPGTTSNYAFPYQSPSDPPDGATLGKNLAEAVDTALDGVDDRLDVVEANYLNGTAIAVTSTATVGSASAGFTNAGAVARTALAGKLVYIKLDITNTAAITATTANIADTTVFNVNASFRPTERVTANFGANPGSGEVTLETNGDVILRSADTTIGAASTIRMVFIFLKA